MTEELKEFSVYLEIQGTVLETIEASSEEEAKELIIKEAVDAFNDYTITKFSVLEIQGE